LQCAFAPQALLALQAKSLRGEALSLAQLSKFRAGKRAPSEAQLEELRKLHAECHPVRITA
jgi:hypothetical protein